MLRELERPLVIARVMRLHPFAARQEPVLDADRLILEQPLCLAEPGSPDRRCLTARVILRQIHRYKRGSAGVTRLEMEGKRKLAGGDGELDAAIPPGSFGEAFQIRGRQATTLIGCRQQLERLPPRVAADGLAPSVQRLIEIDLRHAPAPTVPDIVPFSGRPRSPACRAGWRRP